MSYENIRPKIIASMRLYADQHVPVGHFLTAVMENNLMESVARADEGNLSAIAEICQFVYNEIPSDCHGSPERVRAWLEKPTKENENER